MCIGIVTVLVITEFCVSAPRATKVSMHVEKGLGNFYVLLVYTNVCSMIKAAQFFNTIVQ